MEKFDKEFNIKFLITNKLFALRRNNLPTLTYRQVEETLYSTKWEKSVPEHLCDIARDIESLSVEEVVNFLTHEALTSKYDLADLDQDFAGGENEK